MLIFINGHFQNYKTGKVRKNKNKVIKIYRKMYSRENVVEKIDVE